jgi:arginine/serine-rich splicing factor 4/5/6
MEYALEKLDDTELNGRRLKLVEESKSRGRSRSRSRSNARSK